MKKLLTRFSPLLKRPYGKPLLIFIIATLGGLFFVGQDFSYDFFLEKPFDWKQALAYELILFYGLAILFPLVIKVSKKYRLNRENWQKNLPIHLIVGILLALLHRSVTVLAASPFLGPAMVSHGYPGWIYAKIFGGSFNSLIEYWLIVGGFYALEYYKQYREQKILSAQLEAQLAQAQLQAMKMQLQPHFLFNTLHAISTLMDDDVKSARRMMARLSDLLRQTLDHIGVQEVPLTQEIEFLKTYLEIEQTRFQDRLAVKYQINENVMDALVPNLILQPLVENAIKHGILPRPEGGCIEIAAHQKDDRLILEVKDDGVGIPDQNFDWIKQGLGISSTKKRLQSLYGTRHRFEIKNRENGGLVVQLSLPSKTI